MKSFKNGSNYGSICYKREINNQNLSVPDHWKNQMVSIFGWIIRKNIVIVELNGFASNTKALPKPCTMHIDTLKYFSSSMSKNEALFLPKNSFFVWQGKFQSKLSVVAVEFLSKNWLHSLTCCKKGTLVMEFPCNHRFQRPCIEMSRGSEKTRQRTALGY